ncbi:MAG: Unknown protein [uncultured Aureispira sp.]|uniref:YARHG domain-containing protein n=1 Tax=uncultured Aureispira sp. TaxID=1331704 RepID=A0A6S6SPE4_9BACT|nr:MAG: Unknown protein [uncultured Aureispira sp.]
MKKLTYLIISVVFAFSCNSNIKDTETKIVLEKGTEVLEENTKQEGQEVLPTEKKVALLGFWVGYFKKDAQKDGTEKEVYVDQGFYWNRDNKINISIDTITDSLVIGHSVVAGNDRPFKGTLQNGIFEVQEPGDDKYDGKFKFEISENKLIGTWTAYKNIDIKHRTYELKKMNFSYQPNILLEEVTEYVDWNALNEEKTIEGYQDGEFGNWIRKEFATATELIYSINASNTLLNKEDVENLKKGDITIIRNTIYARHGYSFKNRPLRVFFDAQSWYIPVHTDIKADFTEIEKTNIKLLLRYEKNAVEYYDHFGRG